MTHAVPHKESSAKDLLQGVDDALDQLQAAHASYKDALAIAIDRELSSDGMPAIRNQGRAYAHAVRRYSDAVMEWLVVVETHSANARQLLRKGQGGESPSSRRVAR